MNRAGRLYLQLNRDYPGIDAAKTPKSQRINKETMWYVEVLESYAKYLKPGSYAPKFEYSLFLKYASLHFYSSNTVRLAFKGRPIAELYLCDIGVGGRVINKRKMDMDELVAPKYSSLESMLHSKVPSLNMNEAEQIIAAVSRQLSNHNGHERCFGGNYADVMRKERERQHNAERDEMLCELRAANRWK